jgi:hypothetical protein
MKYYAKYGGKWIKIARKIPRRHSDAIKNRYYSVLRKREGAEVVAYRPQMALPTCSTGMTYDYVATQDIFTEEESLA